MFEERGGQGLCDTDDVRDSEYVCGRHDDRLKCVCDRWEGDDGCVWGGGRWRWQLGSLGRVERLRVLLVFEVLRQVGV